MRRRLGKRGEGLLLAFILTGLMSGLISAVVVLNAARSLTLFAGRWPGAWAIAWIAAFPALLILRPVAAWMTARIVRAVNGRPTGEAGATSP